MTITLDPATDTVTMTRAEYEALIEAVEDARDLAHLAVQEERERLLAGESPVRVWRRHRGLTLGELADRAGIAPSYLSEIETGRKPGSVAALGKLAEALGVELDDVAP